MAWLNWLLGFLFFISIVEAMRWESDRKFERELLKRAMEEDTRKSECEE